MEICRKAGISQATYFNWKKYDGLLPTEMRTLGNFSTIFQPPYLIYEKLLNSAIVSISVVIISSPLTTCAAYAFSRFRKRGERIMLVTILAIQFVPAVVIVLPLFLMFRSLGMLDTQR